MTMAMHCSNRGSSSEKIIWSNPITVQGVQSLLKSSSLNAANNICVNNNGSLQQLANQNMDTGRYSTREVREKKTTISNNNNSNNNTRDADMTMCSTDMDTSRESGYTTTASSSSSIHVFSDEVVGNDDVIARAR